MLIAFTYIQSTHAQDTLPVLTKNDYNQWQSLSQTQISQNGKWIAYRITLVEGNDTLYITSADPGIDSTYSFAFGSNPVFSENGQWAALRTGYSEKELEKKKEKKQAIRYNMVLIHLSDGKRQSFKEIKSFSFSKTSRVLAMQAYPPEKSKLKSSDLLIRDLISGTTRNFGNISDWKFNKPGDRLALITDARNKFGNGVSLMIPKENRMIVLASDTNTFRDLSWEREGKALAFLQTVYDTGFSQPTHNIIAIPNVYQPEIKKLFKPSASGSFPDSMRIKESFTPQWSKDLSVVYFGIEKWEAKKAKEKKAKKKKEKKPGVDIWHWKDDPIQPRQKKTYNMDRNFSYICSWIPDNGRFNRLANPDVRFGSPTGDGSHVLLWDDQAFKPQFKLQYVNYYIADPKTGNKVLVLKHHIRNVSSSPGGKFLLYFSDKHWWTYEIATGKKTNLTQSIQVPFWNIRDDHPAAERPPFGNGGWTGEDQSVLLNDEYDVWLVKPNGTSTVRLTNGRGTRTRYRVYRTNYEKRYIDTKEPVYLSMFGDTTKQSGFAVRTTKNKIKTLLFEDRYNSRLQKAKNSNEFIYSSQSYEKSPNVYFTGANFKKPVRVTNTNPQQAKFAWGKTELVSFKNRKGKTLQGVLHYPAKYEPGKKYPMLVYIYEIRSNSLHYYIVPSPKSFYNITNYVQQGYFVFQPDIVYDIDHPGESAVDCVVPAVNKMIASGMIDEKKIGLMGHSWGAYQTSFIVTQTNLFSAAVAGAPLTDMISMYNSIYWNSGTPDQQIFETSQGRLSKPWWKLLKEYMDNSPMFQAAKINTPMLVTFGDHDGAVDWHQGIEMYITMRRMEKPMILLVYAGENHAVRKKENMLDYTRRINEFFDYYLLGKPPKPWITNGVKYIDKKKAEKK